MVGATSAAVAVLVAATDDDGRLSVTLLFPIPFSPSLALPRPEELLLCFTSTIRILSFYQAKATVWLKKTHHEGLHTHREIPREYDWKERHSTEHSVFIYIILGFSI